MKNKILSLLLPAMLCCLGTVFSYAQTGEWTIVSSYSVPGKASGLAWDGSFLYYGIYGAQGDRVYRFDPTTAQAELLFTNPYIGDSYGMTFDGEHLWIIDRDGSPAYALQLGLDGTIISQFDLPDQYMSGIAYDDGNFWVCTYYPDPGKVYKVDNTGTVMHEFIPPEDQPWDICLQDDDLWIVDYYAYTIHKVDQDGTILESHESEIERPAGIVFDGTYIWYVAGALGSNSTLYQVDPGGSGAPAIVVPVVSYDYGNITIGDDGVWNMEVFNTGSAPLIIENIAFDENLPFYTDQSFPVEILPEDSFEFSIIFSPTEPGEATGNAILDSNDPIQGAIELSVTGFGLKSGPFIYQLITEYDYGTIRKGASKYWRMQLQNRGDAILSIESISIDNTGFYVETSATFPLNLAPLGMASFDIWFWPTESTSYAAQLILVSNDPEQNPFEVQLTGQGLEEAYEIGTPLWEYQITGGSDNSPKAIGYISDITGDGIEDVIVCSEDNFIRAFNGNASGEGQVIWEREISSGSIYQQNALSTIGDIDNDGYQDIVVGTAWGDRSVVALSGKTGDILWKHQTNTYGSGGWVYQIDTRFDFNNDGIADVLAATGNDGTNTGPRRIYCLDGKNGTPIWECFVNSAAYAVIGIPDVNGDGIPDVIAGTTSPNETEGRVIGINGANGEIMWTHTTSGSAVFALESIDDINEDGIPDIIAGSFNGNIYLINPVNGQVLEQGYIGNNLLIQFFRLDDIDNDGYVDILPAKSGNTLYVISGKTGQPIWSQVMADQTWNLSPIHDLTGSGKKDIALGTLYQNNYVYFIRGIDGAELFSAPFGEAVDALTVIPDITGDNSWEMVAGGRNGKLVCYSGGLNAPVGVSKHQMSPDKMHGQAYPNPFHSQTNIQLNLPETTTVTLRIVDINGKTIWLHEYVQLQKGKHQLMWNGTDTEGNRMPQGIYLYELRYGTKVSTGRLILIP